MIWNYFKIAGSHSKHGGAKNATCIFCDNFCSGCSSSRAMAHILGRPVPEQSKANVRPRAPIRKGDDGRYAQFKTTQKVLNKQVVTKEERLSSSKSRQTVLDLTSPGKRTGEVKIVESKTLDSSYCRCLLRECYTIQRNEFAFISLPYLHTARSAEM